jgi:hypothetical protein
MTGAIARRPAITDLMRRHPDLAERLPCLRESLESGAPSISYTQWEAYLAILHKKDLLLAVPEPTAPRDHTLAASDPQRLVQQGSQKAHLERLRLLLNERHPIRFENADRLAIKVFRTSLLDMLRRSATDPAQEQRNRLGR